MLQHIIMGTGSHLQLERCQCFTLCPPPPHGYCICFEDACSSVRKWPMLKANIAWRHSARGLSDRLTNSIKQHTYAQSDASMCKQLHVPSSTFAQRLANEDHLQPEHLSLIVCGLLGTSTTYMLEESRHVGAAAHTYTMYMHVCRPAS